MAQKSLWTEFDEAVAQTPTGRPAGPTPRPAPASSLGAEFDALAAPGGPPSPEQSILPSSFRAVSSFMQDPIGGIKKAWEVGTSPIPAVQRGAAKVAEAIGPGVRTAIGHDVGNIGQLYDPVMEAGRHAIEADATGYRGGNYPNALQVGDYLKSFVSGAVPAFYKARMAQIVSPPAALEASREAGGRAMIEEGLPAILTPIDLVGYAIGGVPGSVSKGVMGGATGILRGKAALKAESLIAQLRTIGSVEKAANPTAIREGLLALEREIGSLETKQRLLHGVDTLIASGFVVEGADQIRKGAESGDMSQVAQGLFRVGMGGAGALGSAHAAIEKGHPAQIARASQITRRALEPPLAPQKGLPEVPPEPTINARDLPPQPGPPTPVTEIHPIGSSVHFTPTSKTYGETFGKVVGYELDPVSGEPYALQIKTPSGLLETIGPEHNPVNIDIGEFTSPGLRQLTPPPPESEAPTMVKPQPAEIARVPRAEWEAGEAALTPPAKPTELPLVPEVPKPAPPEAPRRIPEALLNKGRKLATEMGGDASVGDLQKELEVGYGEAARIRGALMREGSIQADLPPAPEAGVSRETLPLAAALRPNLEAPPKPVAVKLTPAHEEVIAALSQKSAKGGMGFEKATAKKAIMELLAENPEASQEELALKAIQKLSRFGRPDITQAGMPNWMKKIVNRFSSKTPPAPEASEVPPSPARGPKGTFPRDQVSRMEAFKKPIVGEASGPSTPEMPMGVARGGQRFKGDVNPNWYDSPPAAIQGLRSVSDDPAAQAHFEKARGPAVKLLDFANEFGISEKEVLSRRAGQPIDKKLVYAARVMADRSVREYVAAANGYSVRPGSKDAKDALLTALQRHINFQTALKSVAAEWGRTGSAFKAPVRPLGKFVRGGLEAPGPTEITMGIPQAQLDGLLNKLGGDEGLDKLVRLTAAIGDQNPEVIQRIVGQMAQAATQPKFSDKIYEYWINGLLSGPLTHSTNFISNVLNAAVFMPFEKTAQVGLSKLGPKSTRRSFREIPKMYRGAIELGAAEGLRAGLRTLLTEKGVFIGKTPAHAGRLLARGASIAKEAYQGGWDGARTRAKFKELPEFHKYLFAAPETSVGKLDLEKILREPSIAGVKGKIIRAPSRAMGAADDIVKSLIHSMELYSGSFRIARDEGLLGSERIATRMKELIEHPIVDSASLAELKSRLSRGGQITPEGELMLKAANLQERARNRSLYWTFNQPRQFDMQMKLWGKNRSLRPATRWVLPFANTQINIAALGLERAVVGPTKGVFWTIPKLLLRVSKDPEVLDKLTEDGAKAITGLTLMMGIMPLVASDRIRGSRVSDFRERVTKETAGEQELSIRVGDQWVEFKRMEPLATIVGIMTDVYENRNKPWTKELLGIGLHSITQNLTSKTFAQQLYEVLEVMQGDQPGQAGMKLARSNIASFVPNIVAQTARALDQFEREQPSITEGIMSRIPGVRKQLPPFSDIFGEPTRAREGGVVEKMTSPFARSESRPDPVISKLVELEAWRGVPTGDPGIPAELAAEGMALTEADKKVIQQAKGMQLYDSLADLISNPELSKYDKATQKKIINDMAGMSSSAINARALSLLLNGEKITLEELTLAKGRSAAERQRISPLPPRP